MTAADVSPGDTAVTCLPGGVGDGKVTLGSAAWAPGQLLSSLPPHLLTLF